MAEPLLNAPQAQAVIHDAGPLLVFAGAGSGKTRVITYRIANLVAEHRVPPYRILAVTFTNKAAGEMKERLSRLMGPEVVGDLWIGTFHALCVRFLRKHHEEAGLAKSFLIYDDSDQKAVMARVLEQLGWDDRQLPPKKALQRIHAEKREGRGPAEAQFDDADPSFHTIYERYQAAMRVANALDFEDLLLEVMKLVEEPDSPAGRDLRSRFDHVLVDEFQDTNIVQYRIVRALAGRTRNLCVVGDDDQSIYRWRGADVRLIRGFRHDFGDATVVKLEQNYRSTANIVAAALGVIEKADSREPKELWTASEAGAPVRIVAVSDEREEAETVVRGIRELKAAGVDLRSVAVFYRIHAMSRVLEEALRGADLPYQIIGGTRFFDRAEVKDLLGYLRLVENPRSDADLLRVINVPTRGIGNKTVERLLEIAYRRGTSAYDAIEAAVEELGARSATGKKLASFRELMESFRERATRLVPSELAQAVLEDTGYEKALVQDDTAESDARRENLRELVGAIQEFEARAEAANEAATLGAYLERVSLVTMTDELGDGAKVSLMTVHAAKGLEFHAVFITGLEEETFPYRGLDGQHPEELEEERRLAYVAVTRARQQLVLVHAQTRTLFGQTRYLEPSRFLADIPEGAREQVGQRRAGGSSFGGGLGARRPGAPGGAYGGASANRAYGGGAQPAFGARALGAQRPHAAARQPQLQQPKAPEHERTWVDRELFNDVPPEEGVELRRGSRVHHARYGEGTVEKVEQGAELMVTVTFPGFGSKRIVARFVRPA